MITQVAKELGKELLEQVAFVGGCITGLLLTDDFTREQVRHTDDVDLIVHIISKSDWYKLEKKLRARGFANNQEENAPICSMKLGELRVDFMPDDPEILSFSNRWYKDAWKTAQPYTIGEYTIKLVQPIYFVATKLEAYIGRGNNDPWGSRDIEDLLNLFDGRAELMLELEQAPTELRKYIAKQLKDLLKNDRLDYIIQSTAQDDRERELLIVERLKTAAGDL